MFCFYKHLLKVQEQIIIYFECRAILANATFSAQDKNDLVFQTFLLYTQTKMANVYLLILAIGTKLHHEFSALSQLYVAVSGIRLSFIFSFYSEHTDNFSTTLSFKSVLAKYLFKNYVPISVERVFAFLILTLLQKNFKMFQKPFFRACKSILHFLNW